MELPLDSVVIYPCCSPSPPPHVLFHTRLGIPDADSVVLFPFEDAWASIMDRLINKTIHTIPIVSNFLILSLPTNCNSHISVFGIMSSSGASRRVVVVTRFHPSGITCEGSGRTHQTGLGRSFITMIRVLSKKQ